MKKTKLLALASLLLVAGLVGCGSKESSSSVEPSESTSQAAPTTQEATTSQAAPTTEQTQPTSQAAPTSQAPAAEKGFVDFKAFTDIFASGDKGDADLGIFHVTNGQSSTSSGKTYKGAGSKDGYSFTGAAQLGKKGSATNKCVTFTLTSDATVEVYATRGSKGIVTGNLTVTKDGAAFGSALVFEETIGMNSFTATAGNYALYVADDVSSINIFGIAVL